MSGKERSLLPGRPARYLVFASPNRAEHFDLLHRGPLRARSSRRPGGLVRISTPTYCKSPGNVKVESLAPEGLIRAYRETHFIVYGPERLVLVVGQHNPGLACLHERFKVSSSAYVAACNPFSQQVSAAVNAERTFLLEAELRNAGLRYFKGVGEHPRGDWPGEASFLVLGVRLNDAQRLGNCHEQNAIVWSDADAVPQLILLR